MPGGREEDLKKNNAFSLYDLYGHTLSHEPLPRWSCNFVDPSLVIITFTITISLFDLCLGVEMKIFKEIMYFYHFTYLATS